MPPNEHTQRAGMHEELARVPSGEPAGTDVDR